MPRAAWQKRRALPLLRRIDFLGLGLHIGALAMRCEELQQAHAVPRFQCLRSGTGHKRALRSDSLPEPQLTELRAAAQVYKRSFWTETFVAWSPHGSYLATMHRQGAAIWGGPSFSRLQRFSHPNVRALCHLFLTPPALEALLHHPAPVRQALVAMCRAANYTVYCCRPTARGKRRRCG